MKKRYESFLIVSCMTVQIFANPGMSNQIEVGEFLHEGFNAGEVKPSKGLHVQHRGGIAPHEKIPVTPTSFEEQNNIQGQGPVINFGQEQEGQGSAVVPKKTFGLRVTSDHAFRDKKAQQEAKAGAKATNLPITFDADLSENDSDKSSTSGSVVAVQANATKSQASILRPDLSPDQEAKIEKVKEGLRKLQEDKNIGDVFITLDMHKEFDELLGKISINADEQQEEFSLDKAQKFLKNLVDKKDDIKKLPETTRNKFLSRLQDVIKNNFVDLSTKEMEQFFNATSELIVKAKESKAANVSTEATVTDKKDAEDTRTKGALKKSKKSHGFGKGMMHHGSDTGEHAGLSGALFGLAFAAAIFTLVQELTN